MPSAPVPSRTASGSAGKKPKVASAHDEDDGPMPTAAPPRGLAYFSAHWRGELPLGQSLTSNLLAPWVLLSLTLGATSAALNGLGLEIQACAWALLLGWPLWLGLWLWGSVGTWRAAVVEGGQIAAQAVVAVLGLATVGGVAWHLLPQAAVVAVLVQGQEPLGEGKGSILANGATLRWSGTIGRGDAERLRSLMAQAPDARRLELESPRGRWAEAQAMAALIQGQGWVTRAVGPCEGACTAVFLAGKTRQLLPQGHLAFQRPRLFTLNPLWGAWVDHQLAADYQRLGLNEEMSAKASDGGRLWRPSAQELATAGAVQAPPATLNLVLPSGAAPVQADWDEAFQMHPVWQALEHRFPGSVAQADARVQAARAAGADAATLQLEAQRVAASLLPTLLAHASLPSRDAFGVLLSAQLTAAGPAQCKAVLAGDAAVRQAMPVELAKREAAWMVDASTDPRHEGPFTGLQRLETEVLSRSMSDGSPAGLKRLYAPADGRGLDCERVQALLREVAALPDGERKLAWRLVFEKATS